MPAMDDKKKKLAIGSLLAILLAIGGFQFVGGSPEPAPSNKEKNADKTDSSKEAAKAGEQDNKLEGEGTALLAASALPVRDPFDGSMYQPKPEAKPAVAPPPAQPSTGVSTRRRSGGSFSGSLPPFDPRNTLPSPTGGITLEPGKPMPDADAFGYGVSGVITGAKPAAVMVGPNGNQLLVTEGGAIDGDSRIVSISRGKVVVRHKNKNITLSVGGSSQ